MDSLVGSVTAGPEPRGLPTYCSLAMASQEEFTLRSEGSPSWSLSGRPVQGKESVFGLRMWCECLSYAAWSPSTQRAWLLRAGCSQGLETGEKGVPRGQPCLVKSLHFDLEGSGA